MTVINFSEAPYPGAEMLPFERYTVYHWVLNLIQPTNILEVGTGLGGSTYFLSKALKNHNTNGKIYTCDPMRTPCYNFFNECDNVNFYSVTSNNLIQKLINDKINIDYVFFDGPEDPNIAIDDLKLLETVLPKDAYFSMHDWETKERGYDKATSFKSSLIRPYIEQSKKWKAVDVLSGLKKNSNTSLEDYDSVGLCLYQYRG